MGNKDKQNQMKQQILEEKYKEAKITRRIVFITTIVLFLLVSGILTGTYLYISAALKPVDANSNKDISVEIPLGSGISTIANILEDKHVIKDAKVFKYYVKFKNEAEFQAGTYALSPSMTLDEIIQSLKTGKVYKDAKIAITVPEGLNLKEIVAIVSKATGYSETELMNTLNDEKFIQSMIDKYPNLLTDEVFQENIKYPLEGYLFPATYSYVEEKPAIEEIFEPMIEKTDSIVAKYMPDIKNKKMTVHTFLTMSSLIEEEATEDTDRKTIASVFYNRMDIGMPLQTDPTVIYAYGEHKDRLYFTDYEIDDPYNTYVIQGLPPGPIANAGESSFEATLYPKNTKFYYFLATDSGDVLFSETLEEHNKKYDEYIGN
ncbi:endolytic transglycosylase MltG [Caldibacillus lycopersici]|uniref:Endolytic murein transglycosylase n=1 Tax=Perspicuibacillus lycopersici TaxID=1325689 RepID=A0AAE3IXS2_9BACI|nr:endolytic transglycosylase MltG [Perspicuibacillus lycopersici]MCU9613965.1 endolytic transglycosylase MltG [Perspicuibacillus lycopersici]